MITRQQIRKAVPHGYAKQIAKKAGVTPKAVSEYFAGRTESSKKIESALVAVLTEIKEQKKQLNQQLEELLA